MSFKCKETEKIFNREFSRRLPLDIQRRAMRKLWSLDAVFNIDDLSLPSSNHLEKLSGREESQYSIRINKQWRICFIWNNGNAYDVRIINYH